MKGGLQSIDAIFKEAWEMYKRRGLSVLAVIVLSTIPLFVLTFVAVLVAVFSMGGMQALSGQIESFQPGPLLLISGGVVFCLMTVLIIWSQAATVAVILDEQLGVIDALRAGWKYFVPFAWVGALYSGIVIFGMFFFIIPGLVLGLSMSLCFYALVEDDLRGMDALMASRGYVRGHWWNTFVKFSAVWLISIVLGMVPYLGNLLSLLFTPFLLFFMVIVYRDLKQHGGGVEPAAGGRWLWNLMAAVGILVPLLGMVGALVTLAPRLPTMMEQLEKGEVPRMDLPAPAGSGHDQAAVKAPTVPAVRQLDSADTALVWRDPVGDTADPLLDIGQVTVDSGNEELVVTVRLAQPVEHFFREAEAARFAPLITFYLDTDVDRMTGGPAKGGAGRAGYDLLLDVLFEAKPGEAGQVHAAIFFQEGENRQSKGAVEDSNITVTGNSLQIRLPYTRLGVHQGQTIRICFREAAQGQVSGLAKDKLVPLQ